MTVSKKFWIGSLAVALIHTLNAPAWSSANGDGYAYRSQGIRNKTGKTANDLHVDLGLRKDEELIIVGRPPRYKDPKASPFKQLQITDANQSLNFSDGTVPNGGKAVVRFSTFSFENFNHHNLPIINGGHWSASGVDIGQFHFGIDVSLTRTQIAEDQFLISLVNRDNAPVPYADLQIYKDADARYANVDEFDIGMTTGTPVQLLIPPSGSLGPGITDLALISGSIPPGRYDAGSVMIDGDALAVGAAPVPEPGTLWLMVSGGGLLVIAAAYRRRRSARGDRRKAISG